MSLRERLKRCVEDAIDMCNDALMWDELVEGNSSVTMLDVLLNDLEQAVADHKASLPPNTIEVRIPVLVESESNWYAHGMPNTPLEAYIEHARQGMSSPRTSIIVAHVPLPEPPAEVQGAVEGGAE